MTEQQFEGRSVAEAAIKACETLGLTRSNIKYRVVSETGEKLQRRVVIAVEGQAAAAAAALPPPVRAPRAPRSEDPGPGQVREDVGPQDTERNYNREPREERAPRERSAGGRGERGGRGGASRDEGRGGRGGRGGRSGGGGRDRDRGGRRDGPRSEGRGPRQHPDDGIEALLKLDNTPVARPARPTIEPQSARAKRAFTVIQDLVRLSGLKLTVAFVAETEEEMHVDLIGADEARAIGKRGEVLLALQFIANRIINRGEEEAEQVLVLDAGSYRQRRRGALEDLARRLAGRAIEEHKAVRLSPMSAHDRRVFHLTLKDMEGITTRSEGDGLYRNLLIVPSEFAT